MSDQIRVNGAIASWGHIIVKIQGERYYGFDQIAFADKRERVKVYGMGRHHAPRGRSLGKYTTDPVKLRGPKGTINALRDHLAALSPDKKSYGNVVFEIVVEYVTGGGPDGDKDLIVELVGCVYTGTSSSDEESPDPLKEEIELDCMLIRRNDKTLFDSSQGAP
jgi:hypothetical protein